MSSSNERSEFEFEFKLDPASSFHITKKDTMFIKKVFPSEPFKSSVVMPVLTFQFFNAPIARQKAKFGKACLIFIINFLMIAKFSK